MPMQSQWNPKPVAEPSRRCSDQHTVRSVTRRATTAFPLAMFMFITGTMLVAAAVGAGCKSEPEPSVATCGSNSAVGTYYDFSTKRCVTPETESQYSHLYHYAQLWRIAESTSTAILVRLHLVESGVSPSELRNLLPANTPVKSMSLYFPTAGNGLLVGPEFPSGTMLRDYRNAIMGTLTSSYGNTLTDREKRVLEEVRLALQKDTFRIHQVELQESAPVLLTIWQSSPQLIEQVQIIESPIPWPHDQPGFLP